MFSISYYNFKITKNIRVPFDPKSNEYGVVRSVRKSLALLTSISFSMVFTSALLYSTLELPNMLNRFLVQVFPDYGIGWEAAEEFVNSVRPLSYVCLGFTLTLMIIGFVFKRGKLAFLSSVVLYLPTFSYFASTMFFLAGIGILRILWLPLIELAPGSSIYEKIYFVGNFLELGDVVYLPYDSIRFILTILIKVLVYDNAIDKILFQAIVAIGSMLFFISCATWFYAKFQRLPFANLFIYKYSRHPQYLSFLIWSYGLLVYDKYVFYPPRGGYFAPPPLLWLLSALTLTGVALHEEKTMLESLGESYEKYRSITPFMLPLSKPVANILTAPVRLIFKKTYPEKTREIAVTLSTYGLALLVVSIFYSIPR